MPSSFAHSSGPRDGGAVVSIEDYEFDEVVLDSQLPVVLEVYLANCVPCHKLDPVLEQFALDYAGRVIVARIRMDLYPEVSYEFGVFTSPTLLIFSCGEVVRRLFGPVPRESIEKALREEHLL